MTAAEIELLKGQLKKNGVTLSITHLAALKYKIKHIDGCMYVVSV